MKVINLGVIKDPQERKWVQKIIELTEEGEIEWDFSMYADGFLKHLVRAEYKDLILCSDEPEDSGIGFVIYRREEEYFLLVTLLVIFSPVAARELRRFLVNLAGEDFEDREQRREERRRLSASLASRLAKRREQTAREYREYVDEVLGV